jgi:hypothetical protein
MIFAMKIVILRNGKQYKFYSLDRSDLFVTKSCFQDQDPNDGLFNLNIVKEGHDCKQSENLYRNTEQRCEQLKSEIYAATQNGKAEFVIDWGNN